MLAIAVSFAYAPSPPQSSSATATQEHPKLLASFGSLDPRTKEMIRAGMRKVIAQSNHQKSRTQTTGVWRDDKGVGHRTGNPKGEQGGADQPATAPESTLEGEEKP